MFAIVSVIVVTLLVAFALGLYVAVALGITAMSVGTVFIDTPIWGFYAHIPWIVNSNISIAVVPLFLLMGDILLRSGVTEAMYETLAKWLNRLPGGLLHTNIGACGLFAAISGSSVATATTIGAVSLPSMRRHQYDERLAPRIARRRRHARDPHPAEHRPHRVWPARGDVDRTALHRGGDPGLSDDALLHGGHLRVREGSARDGPAAGGRGRSPGAIVS